MTLYLNSEHTVHFVTSVPFKPLSLCINNPFKPFKPLSLCINDLRKLIIFLCKRDRRIYAVEKKEGNCCSDEGEKSTLGNRACNSLNSGSLEIRHPLKGDFRGMASRSCAAFIFVLFEG